HDYAPPIGPENKEYQFKLARATLDFLEKNFSATPIPVWNKRFSEVDLEKRITNIVYWVIEGVRLHRKLYPLDPVWIIAQIMKESYFYEFAVSKALAVGICQFVQPTAQSYKMLCAGTKPEHAQAPFKLPEFAAKAQEYYRLRQERSRYRRKQKPPQSWSLEEALRIIQSGEVKAHQKAAGDYLAYLEKVKSFDDKVVQARDDFRKYLRANVEGLDIFNKADLTFILNFDERFTYKKPVFSMVKMLALGLKARNGNILAATVAYNAGLSSTLGNGMYKRYGTIPAIEQTTTYLSHVLINHYEISERMLMD
ncbi:MAG: transglycosylase SLT domain-containing protein, partial [Calditrichia bacterium]